MLNLIKHYATKAYGGLDVRIMYILLDLFRHSEYNVPVQCQTEIKFALLLTLHIPCTHNPLHNSLDETREQARQNTLKLGFHTMDT